MNNMIIKYMNNNYQVSIDQSINQSMFDNLILFDSSYLYEQLTGQSTHVRPTYFIFS